MRVKIVESRPVSGGCFSLTFEWPFGDAQPGQFVMVRVSNRLDPLLRRPMSIASQQSGIATVIFKPVGRGTEILSNKKLGDELDIIGPFGNSFSLHTDVSKDIVLAGGGTGIPPLLFYAERNRNKSTVALIGGATINDILAADDFAMMGVTVVITTEDGSMGTRGVVTDPLKQLKAVKDGSAQLMACGPAAMLKEVDKLAVNAGLDAELSLEETMGCGFGVCLGCMVETKKGTKRVCMEGPVFKTGSMKWS